jgi:hypothetical protein
MFFKKINKIDKPLANLTKTGRKDPNKINDYKGETTTNINEIQRIMRKNF